MPVELTRQDEFAVITLNRPEALNALSFEIVGEIGNAIAAAAATDARALIITGAGDRAFCSGADLGGMATGEEADPAAKWEKVRDDLRMEVAHSELAAKAVETQSERLAANMDKVEKECAVLYKKLKGLKKQLKKVGAEKDDIEEYLQELAVEHEEAFDQADTKVNAVDAFHLKKFVGAGNKLKNQNVFLKAMAGGRKR